MNALLAAYLVLVSLLCWLPIFGTLYYDGVRQVFDLPPLLYGFFALGLALVAAAIWLLRTQHRAGAEAVFHDGGFTLHVQTLLRRRQDHRLEWREIEEITVIEAPRGGDVVTFRLNHDAAVREGLIQPTTRSDAPKLLARRSVGFPIRLSRVGVDEATARFKLSAEQSGARLVDVSGFSVVVFARHVWTVEWP